MRSVQTFPGGRVLIVTGDGDAVRVHGGYDDTDGRPATAEERRAVKVNELAERYIDRDVLCCDTALVSDLMRDERDGFGWDDVENLRPDPSEWDLGRCRDWLADNGHDMPGPDLWTANRAELNAYLTEIGTGDPNDDCPADAETDTLRRLAVDRTEADDDRVDDWRDAVRDNATDAEVYQWFRVSEWLGEQLKDAGEVVLDNEYGTWWGRQGCGQAIIMDGTFQRIAEKFA